MSPPGTDVAVLPMTTAPFPVVNARFNPADESSTWVAWGKYAWLSMCVLCAFASLRLCVKKTVFASLGRNTGSGSGSGTI